MEAILNTGKQILTPITNFINLFDKTNEFVTEKGDKVSNIEIAYQTYGELNHDKTNVILICHALTGNAHAAGVITEDELNASKHHQFLFKYNKMFFNKTGWWDDLIGPNKVFDTNKYFIVSSNILGSCYGTTGPSSFIDGTLKKFNISFPEISIRDMVKVQKSLIDFLGINKIELIVGGSLGGMQVLEWAIMYSDMINKISPIACSAFHSPWAIGFNDAARTAIISDPDWNNGNYDSQPTNGLSLARKIAMISYRTFSSFGDKFKRDVSELDRSKYSVESYLDYQGEKLINRFDANTYIYLTKALDNHDITRNRGNIDDVLNSIKADTLAIGIDSDILYPIEEQKLLANKVKFGKYAEIKSQHGHDSFLIEFEQLDRIFRQFLNT